MGEVQRVRKALASAEMQFLAGRPDAAMLLQAVQAAALLAALPAVVRLAEEMVAIVVAVAVVALA